MGYLLAGGYVVGSLMGTAPKTFPRVAMTAQTLSAPASRSFGDGSPWYWSVFHRASSKQASTSLSI